MVTSVDQRSALVSNVLALDRSGEFLAVLNYINRMPSLISQLLAIEQRSKIELYGVAQLLCMYSEECKRSLFDFCDHAKKTESNVLQTPGKIFIFFLFQFLIFLFLRGFGKNGGRKENERGKRKKEGYGER